MKGNKLLITMAVLLAAVACWPGGRCYSQQRGTTGLPVYFQAGKMGVDVYYMNNWLTLTRVASVFTPEYLPYISVLRIEAYSSPEGTFAGNLKLSQERADAIRRYIAANYPQMAGIPMVAVGMGENWAGLRKLVEADLNTPKREAVLYIIDNVPAQINYVTNTSRKKSLMELGPEPWNYMLKNHFPLLRGDASISVICRHDAPSQVEAAIDDKLNGREAAPKADERKVSDTIRMQQQVQQQVNLRPDTVYVEKTVYLSEHLVKKPLFALKTNLLFDAATALNVEVEVPIGERWSVAGEWIFPWWLWEGKQNCLEVLSGNIEGRYWFGDRAERPQLTGWFAGLYAGGGYYDLEYERKGYQGEFFIAAGLSGGYAHTVSKSGNWRMEYSLGVGYLKTEYRKYEAMKDLYGDWRLLKQLNGNYTWIGPTRAKISLVWMINHGYKAQKGGAR